MTAVDRPMLDGAVTVITGAASGIGRSAAQVFCRYGARLVLSDIDEAGASATADLVAAAGGEAAVIAADVSSPQQVDLLIERTLALYGRLDCAFNNAAIDGLPGAFTEVDPAEWERVLAVNLTGVWLCMRAEIKHMLPSGGSIVNTSSIAGLSGLDVLLSPYTASKHGVIGLTRAAALEYAPRGIRVNALCPGSIRTPMLDHLIDSGAVTLSAAETLQPMNRVGLPEEVAEAAAWLCSSRSSFVTGHALVVDGGTLAH